MVFPTSTHNYALRYWLAAGGVHPGYYSPTDSNGATDAEVQLSVTPPPQMPATLGAGTISGYSVGEPWNQQAVLKDIGVPVVTAAQIWSRMPEKVLGLRREFVERNPRTARALVRAVIRAEQWLDAGDGANRRELAGILARPEYVGADVGVLLGPLTGQYQFERGDVRAAPDMNLYYRDFAGYPFHADAVWYLTQMRRWGQIPVAQDDAWYDTVARQVYRPDIYRAAAGELIAAGRMAATELPAADAYAAGPSRFIDGITFDAAKPNAYLAQFAIGQQGKGR
jgi:nitrate/nitrite transport system substrate-binding protein